MRRKTRLLGIACAIVLLAGCGSGAGTQEIVQESVSKSTATETGTTPVEANSAYFNIGLLGEEDTVFFLDYQEDVEKETVVYQVEADVTHDGIPDLIQLSVISLKDAGDFESPQQMLGSVETRELVKVYRGKQEGGYEEYFRFKSRDYGAAHVGNGTVCLTHKEGQDYLLFANLWEGQGFGIYAYAVMYIDDAEGAMIVDEASADFSTYEDAEEVDESAHREDVIPEFREKLTPWVNDATIIVSLDVDSYSYLSSIERECPAAVYFDSVWERGDEE